MNQKGRLGKSPVHLAIPNNTVRAKPTETTNYKEKKDRMKVVREILGRL